MGETMPEQVLLVMAEDGGRPLAGALNLIGSHALFGRNWGCTHGREIKHLHFELCYYQVMSCDPDGMTIEATSHFWVPMVWLNLHTGGMHRSLLRML